MMNQQPDPRLLMLLMQMRGGMGGGMPMGGLLGNMQGGMPMGLLGGQMPMMIAGGNQPKPMPPWMPPPTGGVRG